MRSFHLGFPLPRRANVVSLLVFSSALEVACEATSDEGEDVPAERLYALQTFVYQPDDSTLSYVALTDTLDVQGELPLSNAREFSGYSFISGIGGDLLVSSGDKPEITKYGVDAYGAWIELGRLNFGAYGVPSYGAGFERHWYLDERVAYLTHEVVGRIVWDPTDMVIVGEVLDTTLPAMLGDKVLDAAFNRPPLFYEGPVLKPFYYRDEDWNIFGEVSPIVSYDPVTHAESSVIQAPCPGLEVMSQDEQGNTYFSAWTYDPIPSLFGQGPTPCILRVKLGGGIDETWAPDFRAWTGGRPVHVFRYVRDGKAIGTVLHTDEVQGDFSAGYDEYLAEELHNHWRLWEFDLVNASARLIEEIPASGSGFSMAEIDDRTFLFVPNAEWSASTVYELGLDGHATPRFDVAGIVNNWLRVR